MLILYLSTLIADNASLEWIKRDNYAINTKTTWNYKYNNHATDSCWMLTAT